MKRKIKVIKGLDTYKHQRKSWGNCNPVEKVIQSKRGYKRKNKFVNRED